MLIRGQGEPPAQASEICWVSSVQGQPLVPGGGEGSSARVGQRIVKTAPTISSREYVNFSPTVIYVLKFNHGYLHVSIMKNIIYPATRNAGMLSFVLLKVCSSVLRSGESSFLFCFQA